MGSSSDEKSNPQPCSSIATSNASNDQVILADDGHALHASEEHPPSGIPWRRYLIAGALLLSMFLTALDLTIVATAVPRITQDFESLADVGWYGSSFFVTFACFQSAWGKLYKYVNMKVVFVGAVVIFEIGSAICGESSTLQTTRSRVSIDQEQVRRSIVLCLSLGGH